MGNAPCPWILMGRTGGTTECVTRADWLSE